MQIIHSLHITCLNSIDAFILLRVLLSFWNSFWLAFHVQKSRFSLYLNLPFVLNVFFFVQLLVVAVLKICVPFRHCIERKKETADSDHWVCFFLLWLRVLIGKSWVSELCSITAICLIKKEKMCRDYFSTRLLMRQAFHFQSIIF